MTAEILSEALSFIDDELIEETDALRHKKKNYKSIWIKTLSAAACLCIALMAVVGSVAHFELPLRGGDISGTLAEEYKYGSGDYVGGFFGYASGAMNSVEEVAYLEITEWKKNCFYGISIDGRNDAFADGTHVKVNFNKTVYVRLTKDTGWTEYVNRMPTEEDFPIGSKVFVIFSKERNSFLNSKADKEICAFVIEADGTERWR